MMDELSQLCEQYGLTMKLTYTPNVDECWSIEIFHVDSGWKYSSFIYKGSLVILLQNAVNRIQEHFKK